MSSDDNLLLFPWLQDTLQQGYTIMINIWRFCMHHSCTASFLVPPPKSLSREAPFQISHCIYLTHMANNQACIPTDKMLYTDHSSCMYWCINDCSYCRSTSWLFQTLRHWSSKSYRQYIHISTNTLCKIPVQLASPSAHGFLG